MKSKMKWSDIHDWLFSKKTLLFVSSFPVLWFLHLRIESLVLKVLPKLLLIPSDYPKVNDLIFFVFALAFIYYFFRKWVKYYKPSFFQAYFCSVLLACYWFERSAVCNQLLEFHSFPHLKYSDCLNLLFLYPMAYLFPSIRYNSKQEVDNFFAEDNPLVEEEKEVVSLITVIRYLLEKMNGALKQLRSKLNFRSKKLGIKQDTITTESIDFYKILAEKVSKQKFVKAFTIGILGQWGSGKTTFLGQFKTELKKISPKTIIVEFNAFHNSDDKNIINDFFQTITKEVRKYDASLSSDFEEYVKYLTGQKETVFLKPLYDLYTLFITDRVSTAKDQYEKINKALKRLDRQIVVMIDDLDRSTEKEIIEILKIIRNTANFTNTVYMVAIDKQYVINQFSSIYKENAFLKKFFQYEYVLPPLYQSKLENYFLDLIFSAKAKVILSDFLFNNTVSNASESFKICFEIIRNHRDAIKLANSINIDYSIIGNEINLIDLLFLNILKINFTLLYNEIGEKSYLFLDFRNNGLVDINQNFDKELAKFKYNESENILIKNIIKFLFKNTKDQLSICWCNNFWIYFRVFYEKSLITESEFDLIQSNIESFIIFCKNRPVETRKLTMFSILEKINVYIEFQNINTYIPNIIKAIFIIAQSESIDYKIHDKCDKLLYIIQNKFNDIIFGDKNWEIRDFIFENYLSNAIFPCVFESEFLSNLKRNSSGTVLRKIEKELDKYYEIHKNHISNKSDITSLIYFRRFIQIDLLFFKRFFDENVKENDCGQFYLSHLFYKVFDAFDTFTKLYPNDDIWVMYNDLTHFVHLSFIVNRNPIVFRFEQPNLKCSNIDIFEIIVVYTNQYFSELLKDKEYLMLKDNVNYKLNIDEVQLDHAIWVTANFKDCHKHLSSILSILLKNCLKEYHISNKYRILTNLCENKKLPRHEIGYFTIQSQRSNTELEEILKI